MSQNHTHTEGTEKQDVANEATYEQEQQEPVAVEAELVEDAAEEASSEGEANQGESAALKAQVEELQNKLLRSQADFDNFRRRARLEKEEFAKYASQKLLEQLLPVFDNFERAVTASKENQDMDSLVKGIDMIYRQMSQVLEQEGVKAIEAVGQPFNPEFHQAVMQVESEEHEEGIIVEELQKGFILKEKVIRPSMVKVST